MPHTYKQPLPSLRHTIPHPTTPTLHSSLFTTYIPLNPTHEHYPYTRTTTSAPTKTQNSGPLEASELLYLRKCPLCKKVGLSITFFLNNRYLINDSLYLPKCLKAFYYMNNYSRHMENHGALQWKL